MSGRPAVAGTKRKGRALKPPKPQKITRKRVKWQKVAQAPIRRFGAREYRRWPEQLDPSVWGRSIPSEIVSTIMAMLPIDAFCRLRCVCKQWYSVVNDSCFKAACSRAPAREPLFFIVGPQGYSFYSSSADMWKQLPYSAIHHEWGDVTSGRPKVVASAGSTVLMERFVQRREVNLFMANLVTKAVTPIPPMLEMENASGDVIAVRRPHPQSKTFELFAVDRAYLGIEPWNNGDEEEPDTRPVEAQAYDSVTGVWQKVGGNLDVEFMPHKLQHAAKHEGKWYVMTVYYWEECPWYEYSVYCVGAESWEKQATVKEEIRAPRLFEHRGRLLMIGTYSKWEKPWHTIYIWQLDLTKNDWVIVMQLPEELCKLLKKFDSCRAGHFYYLVHGDYIFFGPKKSSPVVVINIATYSWRLLPKVPREVNSSHLQLAGWVIALRTCGV